MKTPKQLFIVAILAVITLVSTSCVVPVYRNQQPYQTPQFREIGAQGSVRQSGTAQAQPQRRLSSINTTQLYLGHMEAQVRGVDPSNRHRVAQYAAGIYEKTGKIPTEAELTQKFGFPCRAKWVDETDRRLKTVVVRPDEVPESIRARFQ
jgi:hypothetical protein